MWKVFFTICVKQISLHPAITFKVQFYDDSPWLACISTGLDEHCCHILIWHTIHLLRYTRGVPMNISASQNGYYSWVRPAGTDCSATGGALWCQARSECRANVSRHYGPGSLQFLFYSPHLETWERLGIAVRSIFSSNGCSNIRLDFHHLERKHPANLRLT